MRIRTNVNALRTNRFLNQNMRAMSTTMERLASGKRINSAADDAAGLAISERMTGQIRGQRQAQDNAQDAISLIQTAEGALNETHSILQRLREIAVSAATDTLTDSDREALQSEADQLIEEVDFIAQNTEFNTQQLLSKGDNGEEDIEFTFQVGPNAGQSVTLEIDDMGSSSLDIAGLDVSDRESADAAIEQVDEAIGSVSSQRGSLGAMQNRLEHRINYLEVAEENLTEARSRIRDADMAREMSRFVRQQIIQQAGLAMLAHALAQPQTVLRLLEAV